MVFYYVCAANMSTINLCYMCVKSKVVPLKAWKGPEDY